MHVELRRHGLELLLLLAQVVLVDLQLLRHLRPGLPREDGLELDIELLLLLDQAVLGRHLVRVRVRVRVSGQWSVGRVQGQGQGQG